MAAVLYIVLLSAAFSNVVFFGKSLVLSDNFNPLDSAFSDWNYGAGFVPPQTWTDRGLTLHPNFRDPSAVWWQWEPSGAFFRKGLRQNELPFWDPYVGAGVPSMANLTPAYFFPPYLLLIALGNGILLKNAYFLTMLFLAGFFTYLLLRRYEISTLASFAGGSIFMFSGDLIQNVSSFIGQTGCCLPFALFVTRWFLDRPTLRRTAGLAFAYASISLASFPPVLVAIFGFAAVYALASVVLESPMTTQRLRTAWKYAGGALLALALVAFYYVPAFVLILSTPQARAVYETAAVTSVPLLSFYQLISPSLVGGGNIYAQPPFPERSNYSLTYIGIAAFTLAFAARTECSRKRAVLLGIAITGAVLVALKLFGIPPIQWIASLPVFKTIHFALYFGVLLQFLIAILAALGLDIVVRGRATGARGALAGAFVVAVLVSIWVFARASGALIADSAGIWIRGWERVAVLGLFATALLLAAARSKRSPIACRRVAVALILIVSVEGVTNAAYPRQRRWDVWRHPVPHVQLLAGTAAAKNGRFFNASALNANMNSAFEIFGLDSVMTFNSPRLFRYYIRYVGPENAIFLRNASLLPSEPVLDAAAISQLAIRRADESPYRAAMARGLVRELDDGNVVVFRCSSHGRFYYTTRYRLLRPEEALSEAETRASWDDEIDVEERPSFPSVSPPRPAPEVRIDEFRRNRYVLSVTAPVPGLIYMSETNFPGWSAQVNGRPARILAANYAFRAVEVPAGREVIVMSYIPPGLAAGVAVSLLACAAAVTLLFLGRPA